MSFNHQYFHHNNCLKIIKTGGPTTFISETSRYFSISMNMAFKKI